MFKPDSAVLILIDFQEKLFRVMWEKQALLENVKRLLQGASVLGIPVVATEQNPTGLGPTIPDIAGLVAGFAPIPKFSFSCYGEKKFVDALGALNRRQVILCGIEAHVCVYQTAADLIEHGYEVQVVVDAVSSRAPENLAAGKEGLRRVGAGLTSVEMTLFELLGEARGDRFKEMLKVVK